MTRKLKVFGGRVLRGRAQPRAVIAAASQKAAAKIVGVSLHELRTYWSETENTKEIEAAMAWPETLVILGRGYGRDE